MSIATDYRATRLFILPAMMADQANLTFRRALYLLVLLIICWFIRLDQLVTGDTEISTLGIDSDQFLSMAGTLLDIPVPLTGGVPRYDSGFDIRTPAYPVLLTLPLLLMRSGLSLGSAIAILHTALLLVALIGLFQLLKGWLPSCQVALATLIAALPMRHNFFMLLAEWQAFCLLLLFLAAAARLYRDGSGVMLTALLASAATLTRPDYLVLLPVTAAIILLRRRITLTIVRDSLLGLLPLILLVSVNFIRFQRLTLAPAEGHLFALLSPFSSQTEIEGLVALCLMPGVAVPPMQTGLSPAAAEMVSLSPKAQLAFGSANLNSLADAFYAAGYTRWNETNSCLMQVSGALLRLHTATYLKNFVFSLMTLLLTVPIVLLVLVWKRSDRIPQQGLFILFSITFGTHLIHVVFVSAVNIMHLRYYIVTFTPLLVSLALILSANLKSRNNR